MVNFQADIEQYNMVKEALRERASMLQSAPHLTHPLPIMLPVYTYVFSAFSKHSIELILVFTDGGKSHISGSVSKPTISLPEIAT
jgi:glycerol-3-phosphate dehydrogenase